MTEEEIKSLILTEKWEIEYIDSNSESGVLFALKQNMHGKCKDTTLFVDYSDGQANFSKVTTFLPYNKMYSMRLPKKEQTKVFKKCIKKYERTVNKFYENMCNTLENI